MEKLNRFAVARTVGALVALAIGIFRPSPLLAAGSETLPVHWTKDLKIPPEGATPAGVKKLLDREVDMSKSGGSLEAASEEPGKAAETVKTCRRYLELKDDGYDWGTTYDLSMESWFKSACNPLALLKDARPSKRSFLADYHFSKESLADFPPCLGGIGGDSSYSRALEAAMKGGTSWRAFAPAKKVGEVRPHGFDFADASEEVSVDFVLWGDLDGDGIEDVVADVASHSKEGTARWYVQDVLTRFEGERVFRVVRGGYHSSCEANVGTAFSGCAWDRVDAETSAFQKLYDAKSFPEAYASLLATKQQCYESLSSERKLGLVADLTIAAHRAGHDDVCRELADQARQEPAWKWATRPVASIEHNRGLCEGNKAE